MPNANIEYNKIIISFLLYMYSDDDDNMNGYTTKRPIDEINHDDLDLDLDMFNDIPPIESPQINKKKKWLKTHDHQILQCI